MEFYVTRENSLFHKEDDSLQHYGILGMKWGVRRYQNYNGTRTAAGKKRYSKGTKKVITKGEVDPEVRAKADKTVRDISKELLTETEMMNTKSQRSIDAAVTGLNAVKVSGILGVIEVDPNDRLDQEWFLVEDMTFGLPQIADLANKGVSADTIKKKIKEGISAYNDSSYLFGDGPDKTDTSGLWYLDFLVDNRGQLRENVSDYIEECVNYVQNVLDNRGSIH